MAFLRFENAGKCFSLFSFSHTFVRKRKDYEDDFGNKAIAVTGDVPVAEAVTVKEMPSFEEPVKAGGAKLTKVEIICRKIHCYYQVSGMYDSDKFCNKEGVS